MPGGVRQGQAVAVWAAYLVSTTITGRCLAGSRSWSPGGNFARDKSRLKNINLRAEVPKYEVAGCFCKNVCI